MLCRFLGWGVMAIAMIALVLVGCGPAATSAPPTPAPTTAPAVQPAATATTVPPSPTATAVPTIKLKLAYSSANPDPLAIWVAQEAGIFKKNNLDAEILFISGGGNTSKALLSGDVQIAVLAPSSIVEAAAAGGDLVMIAGLVNTINYDFVVQPNITKGDDLKGKKGAVSGPSGSSATAMRYALREIFKLDPDRDVALLTIGSEPDRVTALSTKQIDFTVVNPDISPDAKKKGAVVLTSLWDKGIPYQHTGVASSRQFSKDNAEAVRRFIKSIADATAYTKDAKNKDAVTKAMAKYLKTDDQEYLSNGYERMAKTIMQQVPYVTVEGMKTIVAESKQAVEKGLKPEDVVDNSFVKQLDDSGYIKSLYK